MSEEFSYAWQGEGGVRIRVTVEPSMIQANACRFVVEPALYPEGGAHFTRGGEVESPLAEALFALGDISEVLIGGGTLAITTDDAQDWAAYGERAATVIRDHVNSGAPAVSQSFTDSLPAPDVIKGQVQQVMDEAINPAVAGHGGSVVLLDVRGNNVFLEFGGGCQGCAMSLVTLKFGVEKLLRERVPKIGQILDRTDHAAGANPFYTPSV
ncbi:MAG: NifU family protein [Candidatus Krumholzibacteria bacterium]|nr:NifU family protein [Candidatus Krumholzibacteria bacterium]